MKTVLTVQQLRSFLRFLYTKDITFRSYYTHLSSVGIIPKSYYRGNNQRLMICPLHDDNSPSLGTFFDKSDGTELFHCLGCGKAGTVVDFDRYIYNDSQSPIQRLIRIITSLNMDYNQLYKDWCISSGEQKESTSPTVKSDNFLDYTHLISKMRSEGISIKDGTLDFLKTFIHETYTPTMTL
jgi:hypothetical protein